MLYAKSKLLILTSRWEMYPHTLVEARRWGLKIITTRINGSNEIVNGHSSAYFYDSGNDEELLSLIIAVSKDDKYFSSGLFDLERTFYSNHNNWPLNLKSLVLHLNLN